MSKDKSQYYRLRNSGQVPVDRLAELLFPEKEFGFNATFDRYFKQFADAVFKMPQLVHDKAHVMMIPMMCYFYRNLEKTYRVFPEIAGQLSHTSIAQVPSEYLKLPYPAVLFEIPKMFTEDDGSFNAYIDSILVIEDAAMCQTFSIDKGLTAFHFLAMSEAHPTDKYEEFHNYTTLFLRKDSTITEDLAFSISTIRKEQQSINTDKDNMIEYRLTELFLPLICNLILYITGKNSDVRTYNAYMKSCGQKVKPKFEKKIGNRFVVGADLEIRQEKMFSTPSGRTHQLTKGSFVQGHWRHQAYGPQWSERKHIFIAPFLRGPNEPVVLNKHLVINHKQEKGE